VPQRGLLQRVASGLGGLQLATWHVLAACHGRSAGAQKHRSVQRRWGAGATSWGGMMIGEYLESRRRFSWEIFGDVYPLVN